MKKEKVKKWMNILLFIITVGILVYFCISDNNLQTLINILPSLNIMWMILAVFVVILSWYFDSVCIYLILSDISKEKYSRLSSFKLTMIGQLFSAVTPLGVGGQPMQILSLTGKGVQAGNSISIFVRKFLIYQATAAFYSVLSVIIKFKFFTSQIPVFIPLALIGLISQCFMVALILLFYVNRKFTSKIINWFFYLLSKVKIIKNPDEMSKKFEEQLDTYIKNNKQMSQNKILSLKLYLFTFLQFTCLFSIPFFIYKAFNNPGFPIIDMICAQTFLNMVASYTPLPGAAGTTESVFLLLFANFFSDDLLASAMLICRIITYYFCIVFGFIIYQIKTIKIKKLNFISNQK